MREVDVPEGKVPVASHEGTVAGFVDAEAEASPGGYPELDLPSEARVRGLAVTDAEGVHVGYMIEIFGFVPAEVADSPGGIDRLVAEREAELADLPPEIQEQLEQERRELSLEESPAPPG